ncbi:unnamed protein product [Cunninghamella echinulata]
MELEFNYTRPIGGIKYRLTKLLKTENYQNQMMVYQKQQTPLKQKLIQINFTHQTSIIDNDIAETQSWMYSWLKNKAQSMAKKDTLLKWNRSNNGFQNYKTVYTAQQLFPKILEAYQESNLKCYYCRRWLMFQSYAKCSKSTMASFDHAIPKRPVLTSGNRFYLSCRMCNYAKHVFTLEQYQHFINHIRYSSNKRPSMIPLHKQDKEWICMKGLPLYKSQHNIIKSRCKENGYKFVDNNNIINKNDMMEVANRNGLIDPYTNLKGHYGKLKDENDLSECFQMVFGRKKKKEIDHSSGIVTEHGYYLENLQPMFLIIKYAFHTFDEDEVVAWIHAIRSTK